MTNTAPSSALFCLLIPFLPGILLLARTLVIRAGCDASLAPSLYPGVAVTLWVIPIHALGLFFGAFYPALLAGTLISALTGFALAWRLRTRPPEDGEEPREKALRPSILSWILIGTLTILIGRLSVFHFHDLFHSTGHYSLISLISGGTYPPHVLAFPEVELRYHYGFDTLVASVATLTRLRVDHAVQLVTVCCIGYLAALCWTVGTRLLGAGAGALTVVVVMLAGGWQFLADPFTKTKPTIEYILALFLSYAEVNGQWTNPPMVSYLYQCPFTFGLPLMLVTACVAVFPGDIREARPRFARLALLAFLLSSLSLFQSVLFVCLVASLVAVFALRFATKRSSLPQTWPPIAAVLLAFAGAELMHGMFLHREGLAISQEISFNRSGVGKGAWGTVLWNIASFGAILPLGILGFRKIAHPDFRNLSIMMGLVGFLAVNLLTYARTWDIVKFATAAHFFLAIGAAAWISALSCRVRAAKVIAVVACCATGASYTLGYWLHPVIPALPAPEKADVVKLGTDDPEVLRFLRPRRGPTELVYRSPASDNPAESTMMQYTIWGGLPTLYVRNEGVFGIPQEEIRRKSELMKRGLSAGLTDLTAAGVRWFVVSEAHTDDWKAAEKWAEDGMLERVQRFGDLSIYRVTGSRNGDAASFGQSRGEHTQFTE